MGVVHVAGSRGGLRLRRNRRRCRRVGGEPMTEEEYAQRYATILVFFAVSAWAWLIYKVTKEAPDAR